MSVAISYGSYTIDDTAPVRFVGVTSHDVDLERGRLDFELIVISSDSLGDDCEALEQAFREYNSDFTAAIGGETLVNWSPSTGTAATVTASATKVGSKNDGPNSRRYRVTVTAELPADVQSRQGQRPYTWSLTRDDQNVRELTLSGQYTKSGSTSAYDRYEAAIDALAVTVQGFVSSAVSWEQVSESVDTDESAGVARYSITWRESSGGAGLTYGGFAVGGASPTYPVYGDFAVAEEYQTIRVTADILVQAATASALATAANALEAAFRKPRQDLTVTYGGSTVFAGTQAAGTIIDAEPSIERRGDPSFAGVAARVYTISIVAELPADNLGLGGRRGSDIQVSWSPARRRVITITGTYTAYSASATAEAAYLAQIETYTSAIESAAGGDFEVIEDRTDRFETNKVLTFSRTIQEKVSTPQLSSAVRNQRLTVVASTPGIRDYASVTSQFRGVSSPDEVTSDVEAPTTARGTITGSVILSNNEAEFRAVLDLAYGYLLSAIRSQVGGEFLAVDDQNIDADYDNRTFAITIAATLTRTGWVELKYSQSSRQQTGLVIEPAFGGTPLSAYSYEALGELTVSIARSGTWVGGTPPEWSPDPPTFEGLQYGLISAQDEARPLTQGFVRTGDVFELVEIVQSRSYQYYDPISVGSGS